MKEPQAVRTSSFGVWLRNLALVALILLLSMCCYFVYRLSMVACRVEESVIAVSADVKEVTSTIATLSGDVSVIREDIAKFKQKAQESVPYEEARHAIEEALALGAAAKADSSVLPSTAEREIADLLNSLMFCRLKAEVGGRTQSAVTLYGRLCGKYKLKKDALTSAEDFIDQVATESMLGKPYYLVDAAGERVQLSVWLMERLKHLRDQDVPEPATPADGEDAAAE